MKLSEASAALASMSEDPFATARAINYFIVDHDDEVDEETRKEYALRFHEQAIAQFGLESSFVDISTKWLRSFGLFPYVDVTRPALGMPDTLAAYAFRPDLDEPIALHREQMRVLKELRLGRSVILSAPTSFGKTAILDILLGEFNYQTIVIVVPTIALIDEIRRRLMRRFGEKYNFVTHKSVPRDPLRGNVYVLTQERLMDRSELEITSVDLLVVDEFYKIDPGFKDPRASILNIAVARYIDRAKQFLFIGPHFEKVSLGRYSESADFLHSKYKTVAVDVIDHSAVKPESRLHHLLSVLTKEFPNEPTLIYCRSPQHTHEVGRFLREQEFHAEVGDHALDVGAWLGDAVSPNWIVPESVRHGVGIHHGRIPRAIGSKIVDLFNEGQLKVLLCTSTIIEGVNTVAKNIVIFDRKLGKSNFDYFTYLNIRGRAGRMMRHFVGRVILYVTPPVSSKIEVVAPALHDPNAVGENLLFGLDDNLLSDVGRSRREELAGQLPMSPAFISKFPMFDFDKKVRTFLFVAQQLKNPAVLREVMWRGRPRYENLLATSELAFELVRGNQSVFSGKQMCFLVDRLMKLKDPFIFIKASIGKDPGKTDDNIYGAVGFLRMAEYELPACYQFIQDCIDEVLRRRAMVARPDYSYVIGGLGGWFGDALAKALDEFGIPYPIATKWLPALSGVDNPRDALRRISDLVEDPTVLPQMTAFERAWAQSAVR